MYYFMFSSGEYSDYGVGGVYSCDHNVSKEEWYAYYAVFQEECQRLEAIVSGKFGMSWYMNDAVYESQEFKDYDDHHSKDVEGMFQELHNMKPLQVTELWRDN